MTSAIQDLSVAEVRTALKEIRDRWKMQTDRIEPLHPSALIFQEYTMEQFALLFVLGHHQKRHHKSRGSKNDS